MKVLKSSQSITYPEEVAVEVLKRVVKVTGPRGTLEKKFKHVAMELCVHPKERKISATMWMAKKKQITCITTVLSLIKNMIKGVVKGFQYKLRFAYAHFPMNVTVEDDVVEIRNFLGEKVVRYVKMPEGVKAERTDPSKVKDELVLTGNDLLLVSQAAARLHQSCLVKKKDIRKFLDGIYVQTKCAASE